MKPLEQRSDAQRLRFSLGQLFEYTTICAVLAAAAGDCGLIASGFLMLMAFALLIKRGEMALLMLVGAMIAAELPISASYGQNLFGRQLAVVYVGGLVIGWYRLRCNSAKQNIANCSRVARIGRQSLP